MLLRWNKQYLQRLVKAFARKKRIDSSGQTRLSRSLNVHNLTILGIGSTLGAGIYVSAGYVARELAGPSVILSFFFATIACILAGLCYAEFGARIPITGSPYLFSYVALGELIAFYMGLNVCIVGFIGGASVARAWSANIDGLSGERISHSLKHYLAMNVPGFTEYPDFIACGIVLTIAGIFLLGARESALMANTFTCINFVVLLIVFVASMVKADIKNWQIDPKSVKNFTVGAGGFFPYGANGMLSAITQCFFALLGFDSVSSASSEAVNPSRDIPLSVLLCVTVCFLVYSAISLSMTLLMPYYLIPNVAPLSTAFTKAGLPEIMYVVSVGAFCACTSSLMGSVFQLSRILFSMADDGLIFKFLAKVHPKTRTPYTALMATGFVTGSVALIFDQNRLSDVVSVAALLAYCIVAVSINVLRYQIKPIVTIPPPQSVLEVESFNSSREDKDSLKDLPLLDEPSRYTAPPLTTKNILKLCFFPTNGKPNENSQKIVIGACCLLLIVDLILCIGVHFLTLEKPSIALLLIGWIMVTIGVTFFVLLTVIQWRQPQNDHKVSFMVPLVPLLPNLSQLINLQIVVKSETQTWIMYFLIIIPAMFVYFFYGLKHSRERDQLLVDNPTEDD
ncbi:hypothetical protein Ciccas_004023 [Cichlidogyrus casuarinus]|uniref:Cationic amino acid transporter C-terminal domain-containing protein n=1 Tax=Cichlidogyrus casuarinus TaxID=1844966 RepID=A0ABD2QCT1_9PLAT